MDYQGKLLRERKVWEKRVLDFENNGVSVAEFAKVHGFSVHQFYYWKNKFAKPEVSPNTKAKAATKPQNLNKVITPPAKSSSLPDPVWLARFIVETLYNSELLQKVEIQLSLKNILFIIMSSIRLISIKN